MEKIIGYYISCGLSNPIGDKFRYLVILSNYFVLSRVRVHHIFGLKH